MTMVVTGSGGFLGRRVVAALAGEGHRVVAVDRVPHTGPGVSGVTYHQADLADPSSLFPSSTLNHGPFVLVHLAWDMRRHLGYAIQAEQVRQCAALLDHWTGRGLERVVAMGSAEEYGDAEGLIREDTQPPSALSPYGWAKRAAHDLVRAWGQRNRIPVVWLRPFIIYGPGQKGDMMIPYAVECARAGKTAQFSDGRQQRDLVFVDDVARAIVSAVRADTSGHQVCNLGGGEPVVVAEVLKAIADHFQAGERFQLGARSRRPGEPEVQVADIQQAREVLGWRPSVPWREGIASVCSCATGQS